MAGGSTTRRRRNLALGRTLGKWVVYKKIGKGGMGDVFLARHSELGRPAAIKTLAPHFGRIPEYVRRFRSEAVATARLDHPNIIEIHDVDASSDLHYIVMEYIEGRSLMELLAKRIRLHPHLAAWIAREVARGLHHAHTHGIVHRDIKPGNILLGTKDPKVGEEFRVVITDFGLCQDPDAGRNSFPPGVVIGTPYYISPEQALGGRADDRSDLYSLGVTLYVMLTGKRPFTGKSVKTVLRKQVKEKAPSVLAVNKAIPMMLGRIVTRSILKNRDKRYQIAAELIQDLDKFLKNQPGLRRARRTR